MSVKPVLDTILSPLPATNIIIPLNIFSKHFDSFPPMKTPIIQETNQNVLTFPNLRGVKLEESYSSPPALKKTKDNSIVPVLILILILIFLFIKYI